MGVFHWRMSSTECCLSQKVVFHQRSSSTEGCIPTKVVFHLSSSSTYHDTLVDLIFVRAVKLPNLSLLCCLEVASQPKVFFHQSVLKFFFDTRNVYLTNILFGHFVPPSSLQKSQKKHIWPSDAPPHTLATPSYSDPPHEAYWMVQEKVPLSRY